MNMNSGTRTRALAIVLGGTGIAMLAGPRGPLGGFWRPVELEAGPSGGQLAVLIGSGLVEAVGFGAALAVLLLGRPLLRQLTTTPARANAALLAAAWLLGSWWPHSSLHMHFGLTPGALAPLELIFHAGSIVAFAALTWALLTSRALPGEARHRPMAATPTPTAQRRAAPNIRPGRTESE